MLLTSDKRGIAAKKKRKMHAYIDWKMVLQRNGNCMFSSVHICYPLSYAPNGPVFPKEVEVTGDV